MFLIDEVKFVVLVYGPWTSWTPCSTFCGIGVKQRNRSCIPPGSNCGNYTFEQRACGEANCQRVVGKQNFFDSYEHKILSNCY